jgi:hypothetical protein
MKKNNTIFELAQ